MTDDILTRAATLLRPVADWPKPGICFFDLQPLLRDTAVMEHLTHCIAEYWRPLQIDVVAGFDARGFLFGPLVAQLLSVPFCMVRKKGKLPPPTKTVTYELEYGSDTVEMADDGFLIGKRVLLIDDLLATGGTIAAGTTLVSHLGGEVVGVAVITELPELHGRQHLLHIPVQSLITIMDGTALVGVEYCVDILAQSEEGSRLLLVERLGNTRGIAMPGGRVEARESIVTAANRELHEETGVRAGRYDFLDVLTGVDRDPRGLKVSIVVKVTTTENVLRDEPGKTRPFWVQSKDHVPPMSAFVFGHGDVVHRHYQTLV